jgi:mRNA interferase MazF
VILVYFPGIKSAKPRPAVVVTSDAYHSHRPDVIAALLTSQLHHATTPMDYVLQDWAAAGLHVPSAYRSFMETFEVEDVLQFIGRLSDRDWAEVQARLRLALAV